MSYCIKCMKPTCNGRCSEGKCGRCPEPALSIEALPNNPGILRFSIGGNCVDYDFGSLVNLLETDTAISVDILERLLKYKAERHEGTITGAELGAILHLGDIGGVDLSDLEDNSQLVFKKSADCGEGCEGLGARWTAVNAIDSSTPRLDYVWGADVAGAPATLAFPTDTSKQYFVGWDRQNKLSYFQPREVTTPPTDSDGYARQLWQDPSTGEIVYTKVRP